MILNYNNKNLHPQNMQKQKIIFSKILTYRIEIRRDQLVNLNKITEA